MQTVAEMLKATCDANVFQQGLSESSYTQAKTVDGRHSDAADVAPQTNVHSDASEFEASVLTNRPLLSADVAIAKGVIDAPCVGWSTDTKVIDYGGDSSYQGSEPDEKAHEEALAEPDAPTLCPHAEHVEHSCQYCPQVRHLAELSAERVTHLISQLEKRSDEHNHSAEQVLELTERLVTAPEHRQALERQVESLKEVKSALVKQLNIV